MGLNSKGPVLLSRKNYFLPVEALSAKIRGRFLELARKAVPEEDFSIGGEKQQEVPVAPQKKETTDHPPLSQMWGVSVETALESTISKDPTGQDASIERNFADQS